MMLTSEDTLRLNVLLVNASAVRIDENSLCVHGYAERGEVKIQLNPNCRPERYLRAVRELLSSAVLGSPLGYPVYLKRWTRMGHINATRLNDLLMLGEPEAVIAVASSPALDDELAQRCWWAIPDAANARRMLQRTSVANGSMGKVLAEFLVEFLPFEEDARIIIETVRLLLQPGLIDAAEHRHLWQRGKQKPVFLAGFLLATADDLPDESTPHPNAALWEETLTGFANAGNVYALQLLRVLSGNGQVFVDACLRILRRPSNFDVVMAAFEALSGYFAPVCLLPVDGSKLPTTEDLPALVLCTVDSAAPADLQALTKALPDAVPALSAMLTLATVSEKLLQPHSSQFVAVGSLVRKKLAPILPPIVECLETLHAA